MKPSTLRKITVAAVFVLVAISLATNAATGTLSAIGFESIALICPVGALEVMLGLHQFLLHPFVLLVVAAAVFGFPVFYLICPVGLTFATFIGLWHLFQFNETTWGLLLFPALLVLELVVLRKWCHKFCPISAVLSLVSTGNRFLKPRVDEAKCLRSRGVDCHACVDACPELLDPHMSDIPECSKCGKCKEVCPAGAINFPFFARKKAGASAIERDKAPDATPASGVEDFDGSSAEA